MNYQELQEAKQTFRLHALEKEFKPLYKARTEFVRRFNPAKIASMTLDEYVEGKQSKSSFCYILERTLKSLGNISGNYSTIFGVWYSKDDHEYRCEQRLGNDYKKVFMIEETGLCKVFMGENKNLERLCILKIRNKNLPSFHISILTYIPHSVHKFKLLDIEILIQIPNICAIIIGHQPSMFAVL
jgi:hypothetical protein